MNRIGFDHNKYLKMQSEKIKERIAAFGGKLYLEFGGKLFDDFHASRGLPGGTRGWGNGGILSCPETPAFSGRRRRWAVPRNGSGIRCPHTVRNPGKRRSAAVRPHHR